MDEDSADENQTSASNTIAPTAPAAQGLARLVVLTDVHLLPTYSPSAGPSCQCRSEDCARPGPPATFGQLGCNSPSSLLDAALKTAQEQDPSWTLLLGDLVDHYGGRDISKKDDVGRDRSLAIFTATLQRAARSSEGRCAVAIGNTDILPAFQVDVTALEYYLPEAKAIQTHCKIPEAAFETLKRYGYYSIELADKTSLLLLNTVIYSSREQPPITDVDPFGQFAWLEQHLQRVTAEGGQVFIAGHIPPVVGGPFSRKSLWQSSFAVHYWRLVSKHGRVVAGQLFGHGHRDEFRAHLLPSLAQSPPLHMFASLSPIHGNYPAFYVLDVTPQRRIHDIHCFWANLSKATPNFKLEYSARAHLSLPNITNAAYRDLAMSFSSGSVIGQLRWRAFYSAIAVKSLGQEICGDKVRDPTDCARCVGICREQAVCTLLYGLSERSIDFCMKERLWEPSKIPQPYWLSDFRILVLALLIFLCLSCVQCRRKKQPTRASTAGVRASTAGVRASTAGVELRSI